MINRLVKYQIRIAQGRQERGATAVEYAHGCPDCGGHHRHGASARRQAQRPVPDRLQRDLVHGHATGQSTSGRR